MDGAVRIDLITFDAGNTLIHAKPSLGEVYARVTREFGAEVAAARFVDAVGPIFKRYLAAQPIEFDKGSDDADLRLWREITRELHEAIPELDGNVPFDDWFGRLYHVFGSANAWGFIDGAEATLCELKFEGFRLGLVSNWDTRLRRIAGDLGILRYMHAVAISSEVGFRKPHPRIFESVTEHVGVPPDRCLHVGDLLEEDVRGARAAGWNAALLDMSGAHEAPPDADYHVIRTLDDVWPLLRGSNPGH